ncbi:hypothetical protein [Flavobacterium sp. NRK1]|uniref:hypothetical protein n=1 Tax=Flavobacterium sp. NRK1 TaxID=2954929 RepID=UPI0020923B83|nr:hypothetical protein [Flavobacterium sp. NRK1]MCO6149089.1 hypothetical protein [Flavobacterium sp. NRK1]
MDQINKKEAFSDKPKKRQFLGKTDNFKDKAERSFYQRMLKAYLKGNEFFHYGYMYIANKRYPKRHAVLQSGGIGV